MKRTGVLVVLIVAALILTACAATPNEAVDTANADGRVAGFWLGVWHGVIAPITFVISLFNEDVAMYEIHNIGAWYDLGFIFGFGTLWGGGGGSAGRASRRRNRHSA